MMARLGRAIFPPTPVRHWAQYDWLPPQLFGYFGSAAVAGRMLELDEKRLVGALGIAYSQAAGNMVPLFGVGADKGIYQGYAAQSSILSVQMAAKGIAGPPRSLEGKAGLFRLFFHAEYDPVSLTADLGKRYFADELGVYAYPSCGYTQIYIAATLKLMHEHALAPADVERVTITVDERALKQCEPHEVRCKPRNITEAQMSVPYGVATTIAKGIPRIRNYTLEGLKDPAVLGIADKVHWTIDPTFDKSYGTAICAAGIEIRTRIGKTVRIDERGYRYGHPQHPIPAAERLEKFRDCMTYSVKPMSRSPGRRAGGNDRRARVARRRFRDRNADLPTRRSRLHPVLPLA